MKSRRRQHTALTIALLLLLALTMLTNAWIVDDAYITFRTVDNFVHGYGLTWNTDERVQVYTHPLWMLVISLLYFLSSELFFTVILLSLFLSLASGFVTWMTVTDRLKTFQWKGPLLVLCLISSKAFIDYASSGLENPMSYLLVSVFLLKLLSLRRDEQQADLRDVGVLFFVASLAFVNRADTILLFVPTLLYLLYLTRFVPRLRLLRLVLLTTLPVTLWTLFSLIYYGYPFPNTVYAKVLSTGFPFAWKLHRGFEYLINSVSWDTASYIILGCAAWFALRSKSPAALSSLAGVTLYLAFTICSGASATHMSGRFFAVPLFVAITLFVKGISNPRLGFAVCVCLVAYIAWSPVSAVKFGTRAYKAYAQNQNFIDTKWFVLNEGAALLCWRPGKHMPDHPWYHYGKEVRESREKVHVGGAFSGPAIGYTAYAAGPEKHFVDKVALGDPLLAKLPAKQPRHIDRWKSGHFFRAIPNGYVEGLAEGKNLIGDPKIRQYYDVVRAITRQPVLSVERFRMIVNMNLGKYQYLLSEASVDQEDPRDKE